MLCHWSQAGQAECWSTYILDIHHACTLPWPIHDYPAYTHILSSQGFTSVHAGLPSSGITIEALASALLRSQADSVISSVLVASSFTPNFGQLKGFCCINSLKLSSNRVILLRNLYALFLWKPHSLSPAFLPIVPTLMAVICHEPSAFRTAIIPITAINHHTHADQIPTPSQHVLAVHVAWQQLVYI